jgi:hypothetical protein
VIYKASCKQSYFILIEICDAGRLINYHSCPSCWVQDFISAYVFQDKHHLRPHVVIHGIAIFIILRLVPTRLDRFLAKYLWDYVTTLPSRLLTVRLDTSLLGTDEVKATKLFKKMKTGVVPIRQKSSSSLIEHRWVPTRQRWHIRSNRWRTAYIWLDTDEAKVILFINTFRLHPTWRWCCHDWISAIQKPPSCIPPTYTWAILYMKIWWPLHIA